jgi:hypothetical protein
MIEFTISGLIGEEEVKVGIQFQQFFMQKFLFGILKKLSTKSKLRVIP